MSIYSLHEKGLIDVKVTDATTTTSNITLAFAFDSGYSHCFKVMIASMAANGVLCKNPIVIYTDDLTLEEDPIIKLVADRISLLSGKKRDLLYRLAKENVKRPERADWNRGTFLKWCVFEEQATEKLLFLDVDMLILDSLEGLVNAHPEKALVTCPQFQQSIKTENTDASLQNLLIGNFDNKHKARINSGVMLINSEILNAKFFRELTTFASERISIHEQGLLSEFFRDNKTLFGMAPSAYNFQDSYLRLASDDVYKDILKQLSVLHYAGGVKPWLDTSKSIANLPSIKIWHEYKALASDILTFK